MNKRFTELGNLPKDLQDKIMRDFVPYSVAYGRVIGTNAESFRALGSGILVSRGEKVGILTAHHCTHSILPPLSIGPSGTDTVALVLRGGRTIVLKPNEIFEHPLASPTNGYNEWGPDLTFLQIEPGPRAESVGAYGSIWVMDRSAADLSKDYAETGNLLAYTGFPEEYCRTEIRKNDIHRLAHHETMIASIGEGDITDRGSWDYVTSLADYSNSPRLPKSFAGFSGGGIWSVKLRGKPDQTLEIASSALVGVTFFQTESTISGELEGTF